MDHSHYLAILIVCVIIVTIIIVRASASEKSTETFDARANLCSRTDANSECWKSGITADDERHDRCLKNPFCGPYSVSGMYAPAMDAYPIDIPIGIHMTGSLPDHAPPE